jgi:CO/xanthine dehydrogenase FAD-binding subunit
MVLGALLSVDGPNGNRELPVGHFFMEPGKSTLSAAELITSIFVPEMARFTGAVYLKLGRRSAADCALVGVAVLLSLADNRMGASEARVALASVGPVPLRARRAEGILLSGPLTEERLRESARAAAADALPIADMRSSGSYRKEMVQVLAYRAIRQALDQAQGAGTA